MNRHLQHHQFVALHDPPWEYEDLYFVSGKHKGKTFAEVYCTDYDYVLYMIDEAHFKVPKLRDKLNFIAYCEWRMKREEDED